MNVAIVGAGPGGYIAAIRAAQLGARVTVVEDHEVGGTCLNRGCIPTKTMIATTELLARCREFDKFGITLNGGFSPDLGKIIERKNRVVGTMVKGIRGLFKSRGISIIEGRGVLVSPREISVTGAEGKVASLGADAIIIATGSSPAELPQLPFDGKRIISSKEALELTAAPGSLIILGAGAIGCEFACIYRELGSEVTMVEMADRAVAAEDREISALLEKELRKKKIRLFTNTKVDKVDLLKEAVTLTLSDGRELTAEKVLVSAGRRPNTYGIGLETAGVGKGDRGEILTDEKMRTSLPGVYAAGDVTGAMMLAHVASAQGIVAAENIMGIESVMRYNAVPSAIFTSPEIASVGLREHQAVEKGLSVKTGHFQFRTLGKAHAIGEISGFIKLVADATSDVLLGAHIIGPHASDLIHEAALAVRKGLTSEDIAGTIHAHPTLAEGLMEAAMDVFGEAIHNPETEGRRA